MFILSLLGIFGFAGLKYIYLQNWKKFALYFFTCGIFLLEP